MTDMYNSSLKSFVFNATDIGFILKQVKFRPLFDADGNAIVNWNGVGAVYDGHGNLIWDGTGMDPATAIAQYGSSYTAVTSFAGLRDVSGLNNNLNGEYATYGTVDQPFLRTVKANYALDSHGHTFLSGEAGYNPNALDGNGDPFFPVDAHWANKAVANKFGGNAGFGSVILPNDATTNYDVTVDGAGVATMDNVVDYTPRMISLLVTTAGVTYERALSGLPAEAVHVDVFETGTGGPAAKIALKFDNGDPVLDHLGHQVYVDAVDANGDPTDSVAVDINAAAITVGNYDRYAGIAHDENGAAIVADWGLLQDLGIQDTQVRMAGSAGLDANGDPEYFIGAQNPGVGPTNGWFTLFGQFFDHGLDLISKGSGKTITVTFAKDDPLYGMIGPDGRPATSITISRADTHGVDANGDPTYVNHTSPYIDQSQTYGSHLDVTELLREWVLDPVTGTYKAGMNLLNGSTLANAWQKPDGTWTNETLPTLAEIRAHLIETGRADLTWADVNDYHASGQALILDMNPHFDKYDATTNPTGQMREDAITAAAVAADSTASLVFNYAQGQLASVAISTSTGTETLQLYKTSPTSMSLIDPSNFSIAATSVVGQAVANEILLEAVDDHYIAGDGRVNENFGLTSIHHVWHEEHNFQVDNLTSAISKEADARIGGLGDGSYDETYMAEWQVVSDDTHWDAATGNYRYNAGNGIAWEQDKVFSAAKLVVEMEYQHVAIDQYARTVTPDIKEFVGYTAGVDPSVSLEYAQSIFRFGHSQLRETIDTIDPTHGFTGKIMGYALEAAFLNPDKFADLGPAAIALGMTHQQGNEIDEFITPALSQGLLGQPLDLAAINLARGRDVGIPALNEFREAIGLRAYDSWADFGVSMIHPESLVNFIAAYSFDGDLAKAQAIVGLSDGTFADGDEGAMGFTFEQAFEFLNGADRGIDKVDTWIGGLAEAHVTGGLLGEVFNTVFVEQMERIQDGDRFYYLYRLVNQQFSEEVKNGQFKDIIERNTGLTHLNGSAFAYSDKYYDLGATTGAANTHAQKLALNTTSDTTSNEHKFGNNISAWEAQADAIGEANYGKNANGTIGVFSDGGASMGGNGAAVKIRTGTDSNGAPVYQWFIRDIRPEDANALNGGLQIDGTPNSGADSNEVIVGTDANDFIHARGGDDTVYGDEGDDIIYGDGGIDRLYGGDGKDILYGGDGPELTDGGNGDDFIYGDSSATAAAGVDQLIGGNGNDVIYGGIGIDKLSGGAGDDVIYGEGDTDPFTQGGDGNDYLNGGVSGDLLYGDNGDDVLVGGGDQDVLVGGHGDDIMRVSQPSQAIGGGPVEVLGGDGITDTGFDIIDFSDFAAGLVGAADFDLTNQANPLITPDGNTPTPTGTQIEGLVGSQNNDKLSGDLNDNWLVGGSGADTFVAGEGDDVIVGGSVRLDTLIGKYTTSYDHNNNNDAGTAEDYLYQGASHRVAWNDALDTSGILDAANAQLGLTGGDAYAKHFTEMLRTNLFKDIALGDVGANNSIPVDNNNDKLVLAGNRTDYIAAEVDFAGHKVVRLTGVNGSAAQGSDLIVDVENFQFADQTMTFAQLVARPALTVGDIQIAEGNVDSAPAMVRISLAYAVGIDVTVTYSLADGTATNGSDFENSNGSVVIPAGQTFVDVPVLILGDSLYEADETFTLTVNSASYGIVAGDGSVVTITNDDAAPTMTVGNVTLDEGGNATITITLDAPAGKDIIINYAAVDGTAVSPNDYALADGSLTILAGETTATLSVSAINDTLFEGVEAYSVNFTSADTSNTSAASATIQIDPADLMPTVSISDPAAVTEGGVPAMVFIVSLSGPSGLPVTVDFTTANGTATAGQDYTAQTGSVTFAPGETTKSISVPVINDTVYETPTEAFTVTLSNATGAVLTTATAIGTINDNDLPPVLSVTGATITEGNAGTKLLNFTVTMTGNTTQTATVDFATADGTATAANSDYVSHNGSLTFLPGGASQTVSVVINGDLQLESNETVLLSLTNPVNATIGSLGTGTITNDDTFNLVNGTTGPDLLLGTANRDNMTGLAGNDVLRSSAGADILDGGANSDTADYSNATGGVMVNLGATSGQNGTSNTARETAATTGTVTNATAVVSTDALISIENIIGSAYGDRLAGSAGDNVFTPGAGADMILGQGGTDTVDYSNAAGGVRVNLASSYVRETALAVGTVSAGTAVVTQDSLTAIRNALGSSYGDLIDGDGNANLLNGGAGADTINGAAGNDTILGGDGDDLVIQASTQGRDFVDGGVGSDTYQLNGNFSAETFTIYTRAAALAANAALVLNANTEIVIVRNGTAVTGTVIAELDNIEEIAVNTLAVSSGGVNGGANGGDTITVIGDFTQTSLNYNTITINGSQGNDTVDITGLSSAHRIVFTTAGGIDTVIGQSRPQDIVDGVSRSVGAIESSPSLTSSLSQEWQDIGNTGVVNHNRIDSYLIYSDLGTVAPIKGTNDNTVTPMLESVTTQLYDDLAPLAGSALRQTALPQMDQMLLQNGPEMWISGHQYHGPVKWLSESDAFNHFTYDVNGHFIP